MFALFVVGVIIGIAGTLYFLMLLKTAKSKKSSDSNSSSEGSVIFLNFLILNKEEVVTGTVEAKLTSKFGNNSSTRYLASKLGKYAASRLPDSAVTEKIGSSITSALPTKLSEMGITAECKISFQQGPYFVAVVTIVKVDAGTVIAKSAGKEKASKYDTLMEIIGTQAVKDSLESNMVQLIATKLSDVLPIKLKDQFASKGVEATIAAKTESDQARYMFAMLESLEQKE